jgi:hypothetical protein
MEKGARDKCFPIGGCVGIATEEGKENEGKEDDVFWTALMMLGSNMKQSHSHNDSQNLFKIDQVAELTILFWLPGNNTKIMCSE